MLFSGHSTWRLSGSGKLAQMHQNNPCHKRQHPVPLFWDNNRLEFVLTDILKPVQKRLTGNQFVLLMMDRYSKLAMAVSTPMMTVLHNGSRIAESWIPHTKSSFVWSTITASSLQVGSLQCGAPFYERIASAGQGTTSIRGIRQNISTG